MKSVIKSRLQSVQFGEARVYKGITIVPLISPSDGVLQYNTLGEALTTSSLAISEVSADGSVPELMVVNRGDTPVLLVDGEELAGAKQNRVLNTSILIKEKSETKIPVSCTEQGRWAYSSEFFSESGHIMTHKSRSNKVASVLRSLEASGKHRSDQGAVWADIDELEVKAGMQSPTSAMKDVFKTREEDLRKCEDIFKPVPNQVGLLAFIGGKPAGADIVSLAGAYAKLHPKLVRSYSLEGLLEAKEDVRPPEVILSDGRKFLEEILAAEEQQFPSVGYGTDYRLKSQGLAGSALVHGDEVIHGAFFRWEEGAKPAGMASFFRHRRYNS